MLFVLHEVAERVLVTMFCIPCWLIVNDQVAGRKDFFVSVFEGGCLMEDGSVWRDVRVQEPFKYRWNYSLHLH